MLKTYKYRIYPTKEQEIIFKKHFGCVRFIYNLALETKIMAYKCNKYNYSFFDLSKQIPELKKEYDWLNEVNSQSLQNAIKNMNQAFINLYKKNSRFPKYKSKHTKQSFQCPSNTRRIDWKNSTLTIPKIKEIPIILSRKFKGTIKTITISKTSTGKYFTYILVDNKKELTKKPKIEYTTTIGIDLGITNFAILSTGEKIGNPKYLRNSIEKLKVLQRRLSKKIKGSNNRNKARLRIARQHEKITNKREGFLHKLSHRLICDNQADTICVESLSVSNMVKNHKLAQAISDVSWSRFVEFLKYKSDWYGKNLIMIDRFEPTSKTCNNCSFVNKDLKLHQRKWQCNVCGTKHDRDINAAINIKTAGLRKAGAGCSGEPVEMSPVGESVKQEICLIN